MRQPTRFALERATDLGHLMATAEPRLVPDLSNAHQYPSYVEFIQAHRHRLEQQAIFAPWDARLSARIEAEGKLLGFVLTDRDDWDELLISIAAPIRCAFWYGWETTHKVKQRYDRQVQAAQARDGQIQVLRVRATPDAPKITSKTIVEENDAFWDGVADNFLAAFDQPNLPASSHDTDTSAR